MHHTLTHSLMGSTASCVHVLITLLAVVFRRMKRKRAQADKEAKLRSPNFMVSPTRLSIRNIPRTWGEKELKNAFMAGVVARATQAKPNVKQVREAAHPAGHCPEWAISSRSKSDINETGGQ